jgi:hypothetical protein
VESSIGLHRFTRGHSVKTRLVLLFLASSALSVLGQAPPTDPKPDLPKIFDVARYVHVEAYRGDDGSQQLFGDDRKAIYNVEKQLRDWNRYFTTTDRDHADLVIVVHKGRTAASSVPVIVGGGQRPQGKSPFPRDPSSGDDRGAGTDVDVGSPDDQLSVYMVGQSGALSGPIWTQTLKNGLNMPQVALFKQLKQDIEDAYPR